MISVLHLSTSDIGGGAAIAASRLHSALRRGGTGSSMAVRHRQSADGAIVSMPVRAYKPGIPRRIWARVRARRLGEERTAVASAVSQGHGYFSGSKVDGHDLLKKRPKADVINLHWVANFLDYRSFFSGLSHGQPLVWTLHDMAPMTGGCHYATSCARFTENCGACPIMGATRERDLTRRIHEGKAKALGLLAQDTTRIVAPSKWMATEARRSSLLGRFEVDVIPNGLDVDTFTPRDRSLAREVLGLPQDGHVILFGADNLSDPRKGMDLLLAALDGLDPSLSVTLASMGHGGAKGPTGSVALGRFDNPRLMSFVYSAADLFVLPTRADNLPNVLVEAMACGTPCVSFRVGGVPDVVRHGQTGLLAEPEDMGSLRQCIVTLLQDEEMRGRMSRACREIAVEEYSDTPVARRYVALYEELIEASSTLRGWVPLPTHAR
ncbi:glycosyltransferase [Rhodobacterales bacterium HKCCSP123]|nr:glycosyltransferase [Rhodobacterales bacterium HKCCSP123]